MSNAEESLLQLEEDKEKTELTFLATINGNIVDACFGVEKQIKKQLLSKKSPVQEASRKSKVALREAAEINESICSLTIKAYS
eukprot:3373529-Ditylum_brightwellii.AAC.1